MFRRLFRAAITILSAAVFLMAASSVSAAGLGVTPGKVAFTVSPGSTELQTLQIINQDSQASEFEVYIEGDDNGWFTITPSRFTLESREQREVEVELSPPITADAEEYELTICVVSMPPGAQLRIGAGVKVPVHVQVTELKVMNVQWWIVSVIILACLAIGAFFWWRRRVSHG